MVTNLMVNSLLNHVNHHRKLEIERISIIWGIELKCLQTSPAMGFFVKRHPCFTITDILKTECLVMAIRIFR